jgi:hypothetical protein
MGQKLKQLQENKEKHQAPMIFAQVHTNNLGEDAARGVKKKTRKYLG